MVKLILGFKGSKRAAGRAAGRQPETTSHPETATYKKKSSGLANKVQGVPDPADKTADIIERPGLKEPRTKGAKTKEAKKVCNRFHSAC